MDNGSDKKGAKRKQRPGIELAQDMTSGFIVMHSDSDVNSEEENNKMEKNEKKKVYFNLTSSPSTSDTEEKTTPIKNGLPQSVSSPKKSPGTSDAGHSAGTPRSPPERKTLYDLSDRPLPIPDPVPYLQPRTLEDNRPSTSREGALNTKTYSPYKKSDMKTKPTPSGGIPIKIQPRIHPALTIESNPLIIPFSSQESQNKIKNMVEGISKPSIAIKLPMKEEKLSVTMDPSKGTSRCSFKCTNPMPASMPSTSNIEKPKVEPEESNTPPKTWKVLSSESSSTTSQSLTDSSEIEVVENIDVGPNPPIGEYFIHGEEFINFMDEILDEVVDNVPKNNENDN